MRVIIAKNQTSQDLEICGLAVPDSMIPANGNVNLTDSNTVDEIMTDQQIINYILDDQLLLNIDGTDFGDSLFEPAVQTNSEDETTIGGESTTVVKIKDGVSFQIGDSDEVRGISDDETMPSEKDEYLNTQRSIKEYVRVLSQNSGQIPLSQGHFVFDDFITTNYRGDLYWSRSQSNGSAYIHSKYVDTNHTGIVCMRMYANSERNYIALRQATDQVMIGDSVIEAETLIRLSDVVNQDKNDNFFISIGYGDSVNNVSSSGVCFLYEGYYDENSKYLGEEHEYNGNWVCASTNNGIQTHIDSGIEVIADTWIKLGIRITNTEMVEYYINDEMVAKNDYNMPIEKKIGWCFLLHKIGYKGTTKYMYVDYWSQKILFNEDR